MINFITVEEFTTLRDVSQKVDEEKINECIGLAQNSDLQDLLGGFYFDLIKNSLLPSYNDLMEGSEFTYCDDFYIHQGIKSLLADLVYSRYIYMINVNLTAFGAQERFTQDSKGVDRNLIKDLSKQAQIDAGIKFKTIRKYLLSDTTLFSRYCSTEKTDTGFVTQKISIL